MYHDAFVVKTSRLKKPSLRANVNVTLTNTSVTESNSALNIEYTIFIIENQEYIKIMKVVEKKLYGKCNVNVIFLMY